MSTNIKADANSITSARGFLPLSFFGLTRQVQCTDDKLYAVKVVNGDGRTFSNPRYCFEGPNSALNQPFAIGLSYSLSSTTTALVNLTSYALRMTIAWHSRRWIMQATQGIRKILPFPYPPVFQIRHLSILI